MKKINKKNWIVSGLLVLALVFGLLTFGGVKAPVQTVYATENPKATVSQVHINSIGVSDLNQVNGLTFEDGVLTIDSSFTDSIGGYRTRTLNDEPPPWEGDLGDGCTVSFNSNGGTGTMTAENISGGDTYTLPDCTFTPPSGKQFLCWADTEGTQYNSGTQYYVSCNVTFYAIWEDIPAVELTGTVAINGNLKYGETLTAVLSGDNNTGTLSYEWRRNGETISGATNSTYTLTQDDIGYTMSVVVTSSVESGSLVGTAVSTIDKADGPNAPTGITSTGCTTNANNDGTLVGITAEMEYKLSSSEDWTAGTGATITNLANGTYNVRYKETATHKAGASANVVVNAYNAPVQYGITVVDGGANVLSAEAGTTITITADEAPSGYVFDKWTSTDGVVFADENSATTTFNMPSKDVTITATYKLAEVEPEAKGGLSAGAVVGIVLASLVVVSVGGFAVYWFVIKKKTWADFTKATKDVWNKFTNFFKKKK